MAKGYLSYYEQKDPEPFLLDSAAALLARVTEQGPEKVVAKVHLAYLKKDYPAIVDAVKGVDLNTLTDAWTLYRIGEGYWNLQMQEQALAAYQGAVKHAPKRLDFRNKLAATYISLKDFASATPLLNEILSDQPQYGPALNNRGYLYILQQQFESAEKDFLAAVALDPDATLPLANLASLYLNTGRKAQGKPYAERLVELVPGNEKLPAVSQICCSENSLWK